MLPLHFHNITKRFDKTVAVNNFSLDIVAGELFFLLGPSGCGKTTCLRMVAGFLTPDEGTLNFGDRVMNTVPPHKRNTGMVFQNYALWPYMTAAENIAYGLRVRKVAKAERERRVQEALRMVRLEERASHYPNQLSGGQQQRVALARALVIRPDVLLLDEPLSNLDAQLRLEMRREIKRLHQETQTTALHVTHDQDEALSIADRIGIMREGVLVQVGTPRELYRAPQSRFVAEFIGETDFVPGQVVTIEGEHFRIETPLGPLHGARREGIELNRPIWCSIRPESWQVLGQGKGQPEGNVFEARIDSVMYGGNTEQLQATLLSGREAANAQDDSWREVKVALLNPGALAHTTGQTIQLYVEPGDVVVLSQ